MASNGTEQAPTTKLCGNCRKDVLTSNFDMHSVHCQRFMKYCDYCDQSFTKNEWEEHIETLHGEVCCKDCGKSVEKKFLEQHSKTDCKFRPQVCDYCNLTLPSCKFKEHENFCGSRTELCPGCSKYIKLRDLDKHFCEVAAAIRPPAVGNGDNFCVENDFEEFEEDFHDVASFRPRSCDYCNQSEGSLGMPLGEHREACPEQPVSCKYCPEKVPMLYLESHEAICPGMRDNCPTCHESVPFEQIADHLETCRQRQPEPQETIPGRHHHHHHHGGQYHHGPNHLDQQSHGAPLVDFGGLMIKEGKVKLPCEFCHRLFSVDALIQHESGCELAGMADSGDFRLLE